MKTRLPQENLNDIFGEKQPRRWNAKNLAILAIAVFLLVGLLLVVWNNRRDNNKNVKLIFISEEELADTYRGEAVIIRDQKIYKAPTSGIVNDFVPEGTRVAKDQLVIGIYSPEYADKLEQFKKLSNQLASHRYQIIHNGFNTVAEGVYNDYEQEMKHALQNVYNAKASGNFSELSSNEDTIKGIFDRRNKSLQNFDYGNDAQLLELQTAFDQLSEELEKSGDKIEAETPGVVMYTFDDLGDALSTASIDSLTSEQVQDIIRNPHPFTRTPQSTEKDENLFAITSSSKQYFAAILPTGAAKTINVDIPLQVVEMTTGLRLDNCEVLRSEETSLGSLVIFRCDNYLERFISQRTTSLSISANTKRGLRVPRSALIDYDTSTLLADIYIVSNGYITKTPVNVDAINDQYALISSPDVAKIKVESGSMVVINPESTSDNTPLDEVKIPE